jgi:hypothetical protein
MIMKMMATKLTENNVNTVERAFYVRPLLSDTKVILTECE